MLQVYAGADPLSGRLKFHFFVVAFASLADAAVFILLIEYVDYFDCFLRAPLRIFTIEVVGK